MVEYAVVTDDDVGESLYFDENAVVDASALLSDVRCEVDGRLVEGTYTGKGGSLKLLVTVVDVFPFVPLVFTLTVFVTILLLGDIA